MQKEIRSKEFYQNQLSQMNEQMAELLFEGRAIEVDHSRSGLKLYSFKRRHEVVQREKTETATSNRK